MTEDTFLTNIETYALWDVRGEAPAGVKEKLRSEQYHKPWAQALHGLLICGSHKRYAKEIALKRIEAAQIREQHRQKQKEPSAPKAPKVGNMAEVLAEIGETLGRDFSKYSLMETQVLLLCEILYEMRGLYEEKTQ